MKDRLINRVGKIISASFNSLVDAIENAAPETVMAQAIRDVDKAVDDIRLELGRIVAAVHLAKNRLKKELATHEALIKQIEVSVREGRDDLARVAIARQMDIEAQIPVLETSITENGSRQKELEAYIGALQAKRRQMQEELREYRNGILQERLRPVGISASTPGPSREVETKVGKAASAFDRVVEHTTGLPAMDRMPDRQRAIKMAQLEEMARENQITERLTEIKGKVIANG